MADEKKISAAEIRKTIATSLGAAFGFVIALVWSNLVLGGLQLAKAPLDKPANGTEFVIGIVTALALTIVMIVLIIMISRWGSRESKTK